MRCTLSACRWLKHSYRKALQYYCFKKKSGTDGSVYKLFFFLKLILVLEDKLPLKHQSQTLSFLFKHLFRKAVPLGYFLTKLNDLMGHEGDNNDC